MGLHDKRPCPCGSGKMSSWLTDARGIPVKRVCDDCYEKVKAKYRPEIFTDSEYWTDEKVDEDGSPYRKKKATKAKTKRKPAKKCKCK
jgi:hypothetical protein